MNRWTVLVLVAMLDVFQLACRRPPPEIDRITVEPAFACPGGALDVNAIILNGQGFRYRLIVRDFLPGPVRPPRTLRVGNLSGSPQNVGQETRLCGFGVFCVQILDADETVIEESCQVVNEDPREREEALTFVPDCPDNPDSFRPVEYPEDTPGGSRVITALRNLYRYDVILTHVGLDGMPVTERVGAGQPFSSLVGRNLYGSWSVVVDDDRFEADLQECAVPGRPVPPPRVRAEAIEMEMRVRCGDSSPACR